jgi:hypothetical protein
MASYSHNGEDHTPSPWLSRHGPSAQHDFSRAFGLFMSKDPLLSGPPHGVGNDDFPLASPGGLSSNMTSTGFLRPSYLQGTVFLRRLEEKYRAKMLAEQEGAAAVLAGANGSSTPGARLGTNGASVSHLPVVGAAKLLGTAGPGQPRGYDGLERNSGSAGPAAAGNLEDDDDVITPLPSRWNKDDKEAALEILGDGYEVRHTGRASADHEASAVRADHYMPPSCGVYYFEITILSGRTDKIK